jgi:hypothetical protein
LPFEKQDGRTGTFANKADRACAHRKMPIDQFIVRLTAKPEHLGGRPLAGHCRAPWIIRIMHGGIQGRLGHYAFKGGQRIKREILINMVRCYLCHCINRTILK